MKQIAARAARFLMDLAGLLPTDSPITLRVLEREVAGPALRTDQLFAYSDGREWVVHFEFESRWETGMPSRVVRYQKVITLEHPGVEVITVVFVLRPGGCPESGTYTYRDGEFSPVTEARYRLVRIWELDASRVLESGDPILLPMAALMNTTDAQVRQIAGRVAEDREAAANFMALAAIRYDKDQIEQILGENPMFTKAIMRESWAVQELMEDSRLEGRLEGEQRGEERGEAKGRTHEARRILRQSLATRFPGLESMPEIDAISDAAVLENLLIHHLIGGSSRETTADAIRRAVSN